MRTHIAVYADTYIAMYEDTHIAVWVSIMP
jgi:hypothetical protein